MTQLRERQVVWHNYKGILSASGEALRALVVQVLRDFFGLTLKSDEQYVEDGIIYDDLGMPVFILEVKGVNGGLKREHVNQVDSHRELLGLCAEIPGLLILNDCMDMDGLEQRKKKEFDPMQLDHAKKLNVKILRTTTLIELMIEAESNPDRKNRFRRLCSEARPMVVPHKGPVEGSSAIPPPDSNR